MINLNVGCGNVFLGQIRVDVKKTVATNMLADIRFLPFKNSCFFNVYCISVLEHVFELDKAVSELARVTFKMLIVEVPVNSDLRYTEFFRIFWPTLNNIKLLFNMPKRAKQSFWKIIPKIFADKLSKHGLKVFYQKQFKVCWGMPSRSFLFIGVKSDV